MRPRALAGSADHGTGRRSSCSLPGMIRSVARAIVCAALLTCAQRADANSVAVGDWVHFNGSLGSIGGGAFIVDDVTDPTVADFLTFCVQYSQHINYSSNFRVGGITDYADDVAGNDPISGETAWIMSNYVRGLLSGYSSNDIQWAIWKLEGERSTHWGNSAPLIALAHSAVVDGWTNDGVHVLNLFWSNGQLAQDQLVYMPVAAVPEPATLFLVGGGALVALVARRRLAVARSARGTASGTAA
jgi:hypothetical protein